MVSSFLRCCCRRWRPQEYQTNQKPLHEQLSHKDGNKLSTVTVSPYGINELGAGHTLRVIPETDLHRGYPTTSEPRPVPIVSEQEIDDDDTENDESHIVRNYIINETENYHDRNNPPADQYHSKHGQEILVLPGPTVTTINMAAERVADDLNWEKADSTSHDRNDDPSLKSTNDPLSPATPVTAQMIVDNPVLLLSQNIKYEEQPNIYLHQPVIQTKSSARKNKPGVRFHEMSNEDTKDNFSSVISEMSGSDSESIYQTVRMFTRKQPLMPLMKDTNVYKVEIKDMTHSQNTVLPPSIRETRQAKQLVRMSEDETSHISSRHRHKQIGDISVVTSPD